jgi:uncharacterized protein
MGQFTIFRRVNALYYYRLKADNGRVVLAGGEWSSKWGYTRAIEEIKSIAGDDSRFDRLQTDDGKFYFDFMAYNGRVLGSSKTYETAEEMEAAIASVKKVAPAALIQKKVA